MALQTSIAQYFNSRKRRAVDEIKKVSNSNKVLILDKNITDVSLVKEPNPSNGEGPDLKSTVIYNDSPKIVKPKIVSTVPKLQRKTPKTISGTKKKQEKQVCNKSGIRKSLLSSFEETLEFGNFNPSSEQVHEKSSPIKCEFNSEENSKVNVPFIVKGFLSPKKETIKKVELSPIKSKPVSSVSKKSNEESLKHVRSKLINSSRLDELKKSLKNISDGHIKLKEIGAKLQYKKPSDSPTLKKFSSINLELCSPTKKLIKEPSCSKVPSSSSLLRRSLLMSPGKTQSVTLPYISPRKLFTDTSPTKSFERYAHLSAKDKCSLILPYKYRALAETFRSIDAVVSMLFNRNETILFSKLKASVQQMSKKNLTETHLGQIIKICPNAFTFQQEKMCQGPGQPNKYELSIKPVLEKTDGNPSSEVGGTCERALMTPSVILERRRKFYDALLDLTKDHHQVFLQALDPPLIIDKNKVTRWHPEFDVDSVPDIIPSPLPSPPNVDKFSTAKDVLIKARDIFMCNPRMTCALEKNSGESQVQYNTPAAASIPALTTALKGIPKSLIEKVRAKQAAKAASMLTRNPEVTKRRMEYSRLPEIARIVRNTFVAEKKTILTEHDLVGKLINSYREVLTPSDMLHHLHLLMESNPEWISSVNVDDKVYFKISKAMDLSTVQKNVNKLINQI